MEDIDLLTFTQALHDAERFKQRPHVLLGNGFSIACRPDSFRYGSLLAEATFEDASSDLRQIFDLLGTTDFERVIEMLELAARLCEAYDPADPELAERLRSDAEVVRVSLARVLAARHPDVPFDIEPAEYASARRFLHNFGRIYTINYDMLLYWTVMQEMDPQPVRNDGFGNPEDSAADYVSWKPYATFTDQRVFYLHGGLHLYDRGPELAKITWSRTQIPLVDQIRDALAERRYPLIVTEGTSSDKVTRILHSAYLNHAIRSFSAIGGSLFLHGLSLAPNDEHLLRRIVEGKVKAIYVSLHVADDGTVDQNTVAAARQLAAQRPPTRSLEVLFYDAASAAVWTS